MKFGKRLAAEAGRRSEWFDYYVDYKRLKKATKTDIRENDLQGTIFNETLGKEMARVSEFYRKQELALQAQVEAARQGPEDAKKFATDLNDTKKFVMLNYIAVVKALKKRNRLMEEAFGSRVQPIDPIEVLSKQQFFTSTLLAQLSTQAEVISRQALPDWKLQQLGILDDFSCPVCLGVLHDPVILSCAHRFCWGCVVAHCANQMLTRQKADAKQDSVKDPLHVGQNPEHQGTARVDQQAHVEAQKGGDGGDKGTGWGAEREEGGKGEEGVDRAEQGTQTGKSPVDKEPGAGLNTFDCPVCRKPQIVDDSGLQVDEELSRFVERLQNLRLSGAPPHGAPASPDAPRPSDEHVAQESHVMLQSMISSHAALVDTLRDLVVPHPSHWLSEVQSVRPGETDADTGGERPRGAAITMGIRPDVKQEDEEARESPKRGGHKLWGAPAAASEALKEQGLHGPEGGDKAAYGKDVDRTQGAALLPPQRPQHRGRLTVVLDLDGTLVSTYTVKRAPAVPRGLMRSYVVGKGGPLNADGVFVVERPGLREFLASLCQVAEVVLFTAGLEDYARPIVEAIDPDGVLFTACLYRPATIESKYYQCVKDMSRLGRPLARTVLVDDTPLAFLNQPHNGIPVFSFKGDPDDRLLSEAILPLIWNLSRQHDVRLALRRRFQMGRWFLSNGFDLPSLGISLDLPEAAAPDVRTVAEVTRNALDEDTESAATTATTAAAKKEAEDQADTTGRADDAANGTFAMDEDVQVAGARDEQRQRSKVQRLEDSRVVDRSAPRAAPLLVCDFDQTLLDYDSLGRLIGLMAPDLLRMWMSVKQPQNFIPMTNAIFGALQRRGITAGAIERTLLKMGRIEFPRQSAELLRDAHTRGVKVVVLSDCNDWLIQLLLRAAGCATYVSAIITNTALFTHASHFDDTTPPPASASRDLADPSLRLAVFPRHPWDKPPHGCPYCPANLCKGAELSALRSANPTAPVVYCGDGANDYCPALRLAEGDTVLARKGFALDTLIQQSMGDAVCRGSALGGLGPFRADIRSWTDHEDLRGMVEDLIDAWAAEGEKRKQRFSAQSQNFILSGQPAPIPIPGGGQSPEGVSVGSTVGLDARADVGAG